MFRGRTDGMPGPTAISEGIPSMDGVILAWSVLSCNDSFRDGSVLIMSNDSGSVIKRSYSSH